MSCEQELANIYEDYFMNFEDACEDLQEEIQAYKADNDIVGIVSWNLIVKITKPVNLDDLHRLNEGTYEDDEFETDKEIYQSPDELALAEIYDNYFTNHFEGNEDLQNEIVDCLNQAGLEFDIAIWKLYVTISESDD